MQLHLELLDLHLAAVVDDGNTLDERFGSGVRGKRSLIAPSLADEKNAGACCRREHVIGYASSCLSEAAVSSFAAARASSRRPSFA